MKRLFEIARCTDELANLRDSYGLSRPDSLWHISYPLTSLHTQCAAPFQS